MLNVLKLPIESSEAMKTTSLRSGRFRPLPNSIDFSRTNWYACVDTINLMENALGCKKLTLINNQSISTA